MLAACFSEFPHGIAALPLGPQVPFYIPAGDLPTKYQHQHHTKAPATAPLPVFCHANNAAANDERRMKRSLSRSRQGSQPNG